MNGGHIVYHFHLDDLRRLKTLLEHNQNSVRKVLSIWLSEHPCEARELVDHWGYLAEKLAKGMTVEDLTGSGQYCEITTPKVPV